MTAAMAEVGRRFQCNEVFVPEMLISARAMKEATALLEPLLVAADIRPEWTAVIGTINGDLHDIGKNLVAMMWRGANIKVVDLGTNVLPSASSKRRGTTRPASSASAHCSPPPWSAGADAVATIRAADLPA